MTKKVATFEADATGGHLRCPYCQQKITVRGSDTHCHIPSSSGKIWEEARAKHDWQCKLCHRRFALPDNPFKAQEA